MLVLPKSVDAMHPAGDRRTLRRRIVGACALLDAVLVTSEAELAVKVTGHMKIFFVVVVSRRWVLLRRFVDAFAEFATILIETEGEVTESAQRPAVDGRW